jgi:hypothetical protein
MDGSAKMSKYPRVNLHASMEVVITLIREVNGLGQIVHHNLGQSRPTISNTGTYCIGGIPITDIEAGILSAKLDKIFADKMD